MFWSDWVELFEVRAYLELVFELGLDLVLVGGREMRVTMVAMMAMMHVTPSMDFRARAGHGCQHWVQNQT